MDIVSSDWSNRHKELNKLIRKTEYLEKVIEMILDLHKELHTANVNKTKDKNKIDTLFGDLQKNEFAIMPTAKDETIAWAIWHIARIEDLTMNILVNNSNQIFDEEWKKRMCSSISDTGNSMNDDEIMKFSKQIYIDELLKYRIAVGMKTREIIMDLKTDDMKRKISSEGTVKILKEGGVTQHTDSIWLLDFWGKKDVAGIILMPLTRHQTLHLNDCYKWKKIIRNRKRFYAV